MINILTNIHKYSPRLNSFFSSRFDHFKIETKGKREEENKEIQK